jgi:hypothetical protein
MPEQRKSIEGTILVDYRVVDGWHVFTSKQVRGLYVANPDQRLAYEAVGPSIEKLLELNERVSASVRPALPFDAFLRRVREHFDAPNIMPGTPQPFIIEKLAA